MTSLSSLNNRSALITLTAQSKTQDSTFKINVAANVLLQFIQGSAFPLQFLCGFVKPVVTVCYTWRATAARFYF